MHLIYVIGGNEPPYKIGYTSNLESRLQAIQTGHPSPLSAIITAETPHPIEHERSIHDALSRYRLSGEWFMCDIGAIGRALSGIGLQADYHIIKRDPGWMPGEDFSKWLEEMQKPPFFASDAKCAELLGLSANSVLAMKQRGTDRRTALACRALLHRLEPYPS